MTRGPICGINGRMKFTDHLNKPFNFEGRKIILETVDDAIRLADITDRLCISDLYDSKEKSAEARKELDEFIEKHEVR